MPRYTPKLVVATIDKMFPGAEKQSQTSKPDFYFSVTHDHLPSVGVIVNLLENIPDEFLSHLEEEDLSRYAIGVNALRTKLEEWTARGATHNLEMVQGFGKLHPLTMIRQALLKCPDEMPSPHTPELKFIKDSDVRESLRLDVSSATNAVTNREWKAATVLAGSVIEALLLWRFDQEPKKNISQAVTELEKNKKLPKGKTPNDPEEWGLYAFTEVALHLKLIEDETANAIRLAKNFRNLIHPGRARRKGQCDQGTAYVAVGAMHRLINQLS